MAFVKTRLLDHEVKLKAGEIANTKVFKVISFKYQQQRPFKLNYQFKKITS